MVMAGGMLSLASLYVSKANAGTGDIEVVYGGEDRPERSVGSFVERKYPGCRILDRDIDDGFWEVKIRHEGREKIVLFDGSGRWLHTLWEVDRVQLPDRVIAALERAGFDFPEIDDNDNQEVETPRGHYYAVQIDAGDCDGMYLVSSGGKLVRRYTHDRWNDGRLFSGEWNGGGYYDDGEDRFDEGDDEWNRRRSRHCCHDDGEDCFDEGDDEWDHRHSKRRHHGKEYDDGEDHFDEGDDEWD